ncbi:DNA replication and repair protein RecF [Paraoerskovia marina]|uniref:DNA replication and repair protein RecF n=1 Tax=Paraoerskovia marina TaxID=545619 RepID=A0A1H1N613_9CELL|nr:DNA replication/repair protein RecF [Paraoerskovia marina]SDR94357.1 DNA replication and repair protein RecF [Paraoerskovia marina]
MYVSHLSLVDYRSYAQADVELDPGINAFVGPNGQGKTNLVEAIGYLATLGSHRVSGDAALVRAGAERAMIRSRVVRGDRAQTVELEITPGRSNRGRVNRGAPGRARDVLGIVRTVLFAPEDLALVKGDPAGRRRFLDQLSVLLVPRASATLSDYDRVLRQRNALLKQASVRARRGDVAAELTTLEVWNDRLADLGAQVLALRLEAIAALRPYVASAYEEVSGGQGNAEITYVPTVEDLSPGVGGTVPDVAEIQRAFSAQLVESRDREIERGISLVGPHRDELQLDLGDLPAKGYASHGESWSFALALRLASFHVMTQGVPDDLRLLAGAADWGAHGEPVLVLDDVFAELDVRRRERLAGIVSTAGQVLVTAAVPDDVPGVLDGARFRVRTGEVTRE